MNIPYLEHGVKSKVAKELNTSLNTVGAWLRGHHLPKRFSPEEVTEAFRKVTGNPDFPNVFSAKRNKS